MLRFLRRISESLLASNPFWEYRRDEYELPNGQSASYFYVHTRGSVFIIPQSADGHFILLNQFRYLNQSESVEFPGGGIPEGATHQMQARVELREESGFEADEWTYLGAFNPMNGVTDEQCHVYVASGLREVGASPEVSEEFQMLCLRADEIDAAIAGGAIWDGMTLAAWSMYRAHYKHPV